MAKRLSGRGRSVSAKALTGWTAHSGWSRPDRQAVAPPVVRPPVTVLSPHLDDAVLSCGDLLAALPPQSHPAVVTVFSGGGTHSPLVTGWDRACGFSEGDDVIAARQREDRAALGVLGAEPIWLGYPDDQQRNRSIPPVEGIAEHIRSLLDRLGTATVITPVGLCHPDHRLLHQISVQVARRDDARTWIFYKDLPYGNEADGTAALGPSLAEVGIDESMPVWVYGRCSATKLRALRAYRSQLRGLGHRWPAATVDESYWLLGR